MPCLKNSDVSSVEGDHDRKWGEVTGNGDGDRERDEEKGDSRDADRDGERDSGVEVIWD